MPRRLKLWLDRLPPFPLVLHRLLATLATDPDDISLVDLGALVETDTMIAGKVLGMANSAFYGRGQTISSVRQAVVRLGIDRLRNVLLSLSINRVWGGLTVNESFSILRFNKHALATAILSDLLAQRLRVKGAEMAFISGLFHDVGELVLVSLYPEPYLPLLQEVLEGEALETRERELFTFSHAEMSSHAVAHWKLSEDVQKAVLLHEQPVPEEKTNGFGQFTLSDILHAADRCATALGMCVFNPPSEDTAVEEALAAVRVKEEDIVDNFLKQMAAFDQSAPRAQGIDLSYTKPGLTRSRAKLYR